MMDFLYDFPKQAIYGRVLPKSKIYEHGSVSASVKKCFIQQVDKIIWSFKLSPETINIPAKGNVQEIQIFTIHLKTDALNYEVLTTIDKAIPSPILFILSFTNKLRYVAAYKRQSESDKRKWVVSHYFESDWIPEDAQKIPLPVALELNSLYQQLLNNLIPIKPRQCETMNDYVSRVDHVKLLEREALKLENRLQKEQQFNRKVEINAKLRNLKKEIKENS